VTGVSGDDEELPAFARGGLVLGPGCEDSVPVLMDFGCEQVFTRKQVERIVQEALETAYRNEDDP
jgi:hypothetical protein